jgi:hypothetical protein
LVSHRQSPVAEARGRFGAVMRRSHEFDDSKPPRPEEFCASVRRCGWCYAVRYEGFPDPYWITEDGVRHATEPSCETATERWAREKIRRCSRCDRDDQPLLVADAGPLCLACVDELGEAAGVDPEAVAVLRVLVGLKEP